MDVAKEFKHLEYLVEPGGYPVVEFCGELFWIGEGDPPAGFEWEDDREFMSVIIPPIRHGVGTCDLSFDPHSDVYVDGSESVDGRFLHEDGCLPDSKTRVYRRLPLKFDDYTVFSVERGGWYCIRGSCSGCAGFGSCGVEAELEQVERPYTVVDQDISAQEPTLVTYASKEPKWIETFRNRHLRDCRALRFLDVVIREYFGMDVNESRSYLYWMWVDREFHHRMEDLVVFNDLVDRMLAGDQSVVDRVKNMSAGFADKFEKFMKEGMEVNHGVKAEEGGGDSGSSGRGGAEDGEEVGGRQD